MSRLRALAAVLVLSAVAAWGAHSGTGLTTQASGRLPATQAGPAPRGAAGDGRSGAVDVPVAGRPPEPGRPWFLTVGDSITFGYTRDPGLAGTNISWAPRVERQLAAQGRPWTLYDIACPGETTLSYAIRCSGRRQVPLLARRSQRAAALEAIAAHGQDLRLIVVALGSNDLLHALNADAAINHPADAAPLCSLIDCADVDIHPTVLGQQRLAEAVMRAVPPPA